MKNLTPKQRFILGLAATLVFPLMGILCYRAGGPMVVALFPILHFAVALLLFFCADTMPRLTILCGAHLLFGLLGLYLGGEMYFANVARDAEGEAVLLLEVFGCCAIVLILSVASLIVKRIMTKPR